MNATTTDLNMFADSDTRVAYALDGEILFEGTLAYHNADGWAGIKDASGRIDECRAEHVYGVA